MNDRELLELAAKAVGIELYWEKQMTNAGDIFTPHLEINGTWGHGQWNPLINDGDAFRLATKLRIDLTFYNGFQEVHAEPSNSDGLSPSDEKFGDDIASAARRAIVRAAAEIGRSMP